MSEKNECVNIIGAGLAGLTASIVLAKEGIPVRLFSLQQSERAQSNLAEGGINAVLDVMGENDDISEHFNDTMKGGCYLADPDMVRGMVNAAPDIVVWLEKLGVPFHREDGHIIQRNFGGQKKKRTTYAKSSTGKVITSALIDETRKYEARGLITRYSRHRFERIIIDDGKCQGVQMSECFGEEPVCYGGTTILAYGGLNGLFPGLTTGTTANDGTAAAFLYEQGVEFANFEFIQYHPTTTVITGKRMLISEAARGEGGRLFYVKNDGTACYFMEEKYGEKGNLMPRDVISREMAGLKKKIYLDLTGLGENTWNNKLSDLRDEIIHYLAVDPKNEPVQVSPGIHYFMGGINVDAGHHTNIKGLYAAGECAAAYHGANRLGGNSLLGAIYGGQTAAHSVMADGCVKNAAADDTLKALRITYMRNEELKTADRIKNCLEKGLGIIRDETGIREALEEIEGILLTKNMTNMSYELRTRIILAQAMLRCALERKETRGAHVRTDYLGTDEEYRKTTCTLFDKNDGMKVYFV